MALSTSIYSRIAEQLEPFNDRVASTTIQNFQYAKNKCF